MSHHTDMYHAAIRSFELQDKLGKAEIENRRLEQQVTSLCEGAARQAKLVRDQQARLDIALYDVEFLRQQGRKSRVKNRDKIKALKRRAFAAERKTKEAETEIAGAWAAYDAAKSKAKLWHDRCKQAMVHVGRLEAMIIGRTKFTS